MAEPKGMCVSRLPLAAQPCSLSNRQGVETLYSVQRRCTLVQGTGSSHNSTLALLNVALPDPPSQFKGRAFVLLLPPAGSSTVHALSTTRLRLILLPLCFLFLLFKSLPTASSRFLSLHARPNRNPPDTFLGHLFHYHEQVSNPPSLQ